MSVRVFVEGGGDQDRTLTACRRAFHLLFDKVLGENPRPRVSACGGRQAAYEDFCRSVQLNPETFAILLVDSEGPVSNRSTAWNHLRARDGWEKPAHAGNDQAHLMTQCMEAWFLADPQTLTVYYGHGFSQGALPPNPQTEHIAKPDVLDGLIRATRRTHKGQYHKTNHGFEILALTDPALIRQRSPHAERFFRVLSERTRGRSPRRR